MPSSPPTLTSRVGGGDGGGDCGGNGGGDNGSEENGVTNLNMVTFRPWIKRQCCLVH